MKAKLGQEPAFMNLHFNGNNSYEYNGGMSKRFYAACAAMKLHPKFITPDLDDEDMIADENGAFAKGNRANDYYALIDNFSMPKKRYSIKTTLEYRLARQLYRIADELLKQENQ
jgi:hypothetical protein